MSNVIDQRVVEMRFDNRQFESATKTSMSTLDKLKKALRLDNVGKSFDSLNASVKKVDMSGLSKGVETVSSKFSALEIAGVTALANITNSAVNAGKRIVSALTIDPVMTGFREYETQMNAIQTILANTSHQGTNLEDVNAALDELNRYSDQTIYNFTEMTRNIGTFTAAGVDLDTSVNAIKGIANLAAISGSTSQQASTAMYQLSQALAAGRVSLEDWNSVVNAGMGGKIFQDALMNTAEAMGIVVDRTQSFRESISTAGGKQSWLTSDVLLNTLEQFTGDLTDAELAAMGFTDAQIKNIQSMAQTAVGAATEVKTLTGLWDTLQEAVGSSWARTWQLIVGDFESAKSFFTDISNMLTGENGIITKMGDARNNYLEGALGSSWDGMIKQIEAAGIAQETFTAELEKTAKTSVKNYDEIIAKNGSLAAAFQSGDLQGSLVIDTLKRMAGATGETGKATEDMTAKLEHFQKIVSDVWQGDYKNGQERVEALTAAGYDYAQVQDLVNKTVDGHKLTLEDLTDVQLKSVGYTEDEIKALRELADQAEKTGTPLNELIENLSKPSGRDLFTGAIKNIVKAVTDFANVVGEAWSKIFPSNPAGLYNLLEGFNNLTQSLLIFDENGKAIGDTADKLRRTFEGLFAIIDLVTTIVGGGFKAAFEIVSGILGAFNMDILDFTAMIGDAAVGLRNFVLDNGAIELFASGIKTLVTSIRDWVDSIKQLPEVQAAIENLKEKLLGFKDIALDAIQGFQNGLESGIQSLPQLLMDLGRRLLEAIKDVLGIASPSKEMHKIGEFTIEGLIEGIKSGLGGLLDTIKEIGSTIIEGLDHFLGDIQLGDVLAAGISVGLIVLGVKLMNIVEAFSAPFEGVGDVLSGVGEILERAAKPIEKAIKGVSNVLNSYALSLKADALKSVATAIAILAGSVFLLAQLDSGKLWQAVGALGALAAVLGGLSVAIGKFGPDKATSFAGIAVAVVGIGASLLMIAGALKQLDSLDPDHMAQTMIGFSGVVIALMGILALCERIVTGSSAASIAKLGTMMLGLSASLLIMTQVVKIISGMSAEELLKGGVAITAFVGIVALLGSITKLTGSGIDKLGSMMLKLSVALGIMVVVVGMISLLSAESIAKGILTLTAFTGIIAILAAITNLMGPNDIAKLSTTLLAMSVSMGILAGVVILISGISPENIAKGIVALTAFTGIVALLVSITKLAGENIGEMSATLLAMSVSVGILAGVAVLLSFIDIAGLAKGITAVGLLSSFMALMIAATKNTQSVMGNLIVLTTAIGVMAAAVAALSLIDPGPLAGATAALSIVMGMFALVVRSSKDVNASMGVLIVMTSAIAVLGGVIYALAGLPVESVLGTAASLSILLTSLSASMLIISKAKGITAQTSIALGAMTLAIAGIAAVLGVLDALDVEPSIETATSLSILLTALSANLLILAAVGKTGASALQGAAVLDGVIVVIGGLMAGLGALVSYFPQLEEFLDKGVDIFEAVGQGIGGLVGGIVGGIASGITSALPDIGTDLSEFMENLQPFLDGASSVDPSVVDSVGNLAKMILTLTGANIVNGIASFFGGGTASLEDFAKQIVPFGEAMAEFASTITGVDTEAMDSVTTAGLMLAELNKSLPKQGGVLQDFLGSQDLGAFGSDMAAFGKAIVSFSETVAPGGTSKVNLAAAEAAASAGKVIAELNKSLPKQGGVLQDFLGSQDLGLFSTQMEAFGKAIVSFSETVAPGGEIKVNYEATEAAANAGKVIAELANNLPRQGGFLQDFLGSQDLGVFSEQMKSFGKAVVDFSETVAPGGESKVNADAVEAAAHAGSLIAELNNELPASGGVLQDFLGSQDLGTFSSDMVAFGEAVANFSEVIAPNGTSLINEEAVKAAAYTGEMMVELANTLPKAGGIFDFFTGTRSLSDFGADLEVFGQSLANYSDSISDITPETVTASANAAKTLLDLSNSLPDSDFWGRDRDLSDFGKEIADFGEYIADYSAEISGVNVSQLTKVVDGVEELIKMAKGMSGIDTSSVSGFGKALKDLGKSGIDGFINAFKDANTKVKNTASEMIDKFIEGVKDRKSKLDKEFTTLISDVVKTLEKEEKEFKTIGTEYVKQLGEGLKQNQNKIRSDIQSLVKSMTTILRSEYAAFKSAGTYLVSGLAAGMANNSSATRAAKNLASSVLNSMKRELEIHSPSRVVRDEVGRYVVEGLAEGITDDMSAEEAAAQKAQNITDAFQDAFDQLDIADQTQDLQQQLDNEDEDYGERYARQLERAELALAKYQNILEVYGDDAIETQKAYNEYLQEEIDLRNLAAEETAAAYETAINSIENLKNAGSMSLIDELAAYKRLQSEYAAGTEQRIDLDSKVLDVQEQIKDATENYYDQLNQIEEQAAQERLQINEDYENSRTQVIQQANQQREQLNQEYADEQQRINEQLEADIQSLEDAYDDAIKSRTDTLYNAYGLFDQVDWGESVSGETLTQNLEDQLTAFEEWTSNINSLAAKGIDEALLDELREMGPASSNEIKALNEMTDAELDHYVELWRTKQQLAKDQAVYELEDMRVETNQQIAQLRVDASNELDQLRANWRQQLYELNRDTNSQLASLRSDWSDRLAELDANTNEQLEDLRKDFEEQITGIKEDTTSEFTEMTDELINTMGDQTKWSEAGANMIEGVLLGIAANTPKLTAGVEEAMGAALDAANRRLGINSPSKEFAKIGRYMDEGLVVGLEGYQHLVTDSAENLGTQTINSLQSTISRISEAINSDIDTQPTIRPVLDLTDVESNASRLNAMFNRRQAVTINSGMNPAPEQTIQNGTNQTSTQGNSFQFVQNNYSPKALSRVEIYRQTKNQLSAYGRMVKA